MNKKNVDRMISVIGAVLLMSILGAGMLFEADQMVADIIYQGQLRGASKDIVTIGIDARSIEELGAWGSWPRSVIGELIYKLNESKSGAPTVIGIDILFSGETTLDEDKYLADAANDYDNIVVASSAHLKTGVRGELEVDYLGEPYSGLKEVSTQGHTNIFADKDGVIRRSLHKITEGDDVYYSFAHEVYKAYIKHTDKGEIIQPPLDRLGRWYIPFAAEVGEYSSGASVIEVLKGEKVPYVKDKIVLIGFDVPGAIDAYYTSVNKGEKMMGVEINANIIQALLEGQTKQEVPLGIQMLGVGGIGYVLLMLIRRCKLKTVSGVLVVSCIGYGLGIWGLYKLGYIIRIIYLPVVIGIAYMIKIVITYTKERLVRIAISKKFESYIRESNIKYSKDIKELLDSFIYTISVAIDERSPHTANHTQAIVQLMDEFVAYLNQCYKEGKYEKYFDAQDKDVLLMSAAVHDIGKLVVPLKVLEKSTRLGGKLPYIEQRFKLIETSVELAFWQGKIAEKQCEEEVKEILDTLVFIKEVDQIGYLTDEMLERIRIIGSRTYINAHKETYKWLEDEEVEMLSIRKGTLTDKEKQKIEHHVDVTSKLLKGIKFSGDLKRVPEIAGNHHELLDGSGYPQGLKGDAIAVEVRMLTILDVFEALTAKDRPYKKPMPEEKAFDILLSMADEGKLDHELIKLLQQCRLEKRNTNEEAIK
ncbi:MAG: CHASE2 domain-containing protein [Cellulosilyticaceae bacterium]